MARSWLGGTPGCSGLGGWITCPGAVAAVNRRKLRATKGAARFARRAAAIMILLQAANETLLRLSHEGSGSQETARLWMLHLPASIHTRASWRICQRWTALPVGWISADASKLLRVTSIAGIPTMSLHSRFARPSSSRLFAKRP